MVLITCSWPRHPELEMYRTLPYSRVVAEPGTEVEAVYLPDRGHRRWAATWHHAWRAP